MSTTTQKERYEVIDRLSRLGIDYETASKLRRIAMTLHGWFEKECGDSNDYCSYSIERDDTTGKPYHCIYPHKGENTRYLIRDKEAGAKRRLVKIMAELPDLVPYIQGDCRGASLYVIRKSDVAKGESIDSVYTRGVAVY